MHRRALITSGLAVGAAGLTVREARANAGPMPAATPKVVYHLSDADKVAFVLGNMHNHIDGMGGPDKVSLALVVHGPPLRAFRADTNNIGVKSDLNRLREVGVSLFACSHTMQGMNLRLEELLPGFAVAEQGGVVKLAELQALGWLYLRP